MTEVYEYNTVCINRGYSKPKAHCLHHHGKEPCRMQKRRRLIGRYELRNDSKELWFVPAEL